MLPPHYGGLGAGSIPFRSIANNKQCEMRGLFMSLVIHYWIGDVQDCQGVSASEMTYIVSSGALNSTNSLTHALLCQPSIIFRPTCRVRHRSPASQPPAPHKLQSQPRRRRRPACVVRRGWTDEAESSSVTCGLFSFSRHSESVFQMPST